jgi:hypothetical protein
MFGSLAVIGMVILLVMVGLGPGCTGSGTAPGLSEADFTIRLSGTDGMQFQGSYRVVNAAGSSTSQSVSGTLPAQYQVRGRHVSANFQKQAEAGSLKVEIVRGSQVLARSETTAPYGIATAATN